MPAYFPDRRTVIVVRAEHQAAANQLALDATRDGAGQPTTDLNTFTVGLRNAGDATATVVAYWCNWAMTQAHRDAVLAELGRQFARNVTPIPLGGNVRQNEPFWVFDAEDGQWTGPAVLAALGYATLPRPD